MQQTFRNGAIRQQLPWVHIGAPLARVHRATGAQDLGEGVRDERLPGSIGIGRAHGPMGGWHMMNRSRAFRSGVSVFSWKPWLLHSCFTYPSMMMLCTAVIFKEWSTNDQRVPNWREVWWSLSFSHAPQTKTVDPWSLSSQHVSPMLVPKHH